MAKYRDLRDVEVDLEGLIENLSRRYKNEFGNITHYRCVISGNIKVKLSGRYSRQEVIFEHYKFPYTSSRIHEFFLDIVAAALLCFTSPYDIGPGDKCAT